MGSLVKGWSLKATKADSSLQTTDVGAWGTEAG